MRILFFPKYHTEGPSSRYRTFNYLEYFRAAGHEVDVRPLMYDGYVRDLYGGKRTNGLKVLLNILNRLSYALLNGRKYDFIIIEKELVSYCPYFIERLVLKGCRYSLDFDDIVSVKYKSNALKKLLLGRKIDALSSRAALITVGNRWYWNEITGDNLQYLPTVIDGEDYPVEGHKKPDNAVPIIVWIGSPITAGYLKIVEKALQKLGKTHEFKLRVIGGNAVLKGLDLECIRWSGETEFELLHGSDIGIMPLESSMWEKGKCGFKLIQYMASGLPVVASPAPANEEIVTVGETGFIAGNEGEWVEYLSMLLEDKQLRLRLGIAARKKIEQSYTYRTWGRKYVDMIKEVS
jgi:glycosyltransferase involved in cell wall biosynthesis